MQINTICNASFIYQSKLFFSSNNKIRSKLNASLMLMDTRQASKPDKNEYVTTPTATVVFIHKKPYF